MESGAPAAALAAILDRHCDNPVIRNLHDTLTGRTARDRAPDACALLELYETSVRIFEHALPTQDYSDRALDEYQHVCRGYEALRAAQGGDRHRFLVIVPTADRPRQLRECLNSLLDLCRLFEYGGCVDGRYPKVAAMIADDSKQASSIEQHRELARELTADGLETQYFGLEEQLSVLDRLPLSLRERLRNIFGDTNRDAFYHKGHSVMRNIIYLHLQAEHARDRRQLFYFADSDQEFKVKIGDAGGHGGNGRDVYAVNYFYHLDRLFRDNDIELLTGKVVGDPPVSPAVMAGNFLEDVRVFLDRALQCAPDAPCPFHDSAQSEEGGAAYHDMAGLFGFKTAAPHAYRCALRGPHTVAACVDEFTHRLPRFFDGEHPTRITYFEAADPAYRDGSPIRAARTVYTGNYVIGAEALRRFVPFAPLRLRMSGPSFGRLLQAELGARFVSANLPMLHKRTQPDTGASEFRPGVVRHAQRVDLSNEFERQFFGDVMLFTIETLTGLGYPMRPVADDRISATLSETAAHMERLYRDKHAQILRSLEELRQLRARLCDRFADMHAAWAQLDAFLDNMTHNFGPQAEGYRLIADPAHRQRRHAQLLAAIVAYRDDRAVWDIALNAGAAAAAEP